MQSLLSDNNLNIYYNSLSQGYQLYPSFIKGQKFYDSLVSFLEKQNTHKLITPNLASTDDIALVHSQPYINYIKTTSDKNIQKALFNNNKLNSYVQWYSRITRGSYEAGLSAVGATTQAVSDVLSGNCKHAFCVTHPPGHHAGIAKGEGYCLFNNLAIGGLLALQKGAKRVAIIDFNSHHCNGTEEIVREKGDGDILLISSFQEGCQYYEKQHYDEQPENIISIPLPKYSTFDALETSYREKILSALYKFNPDIILLSVGFDMHVDDPQTQIELMSDDFYKLTQLISMAADDLCDGRIVSCLEGGYDVKTLTESVKYHIDALS